MTSENFSWKNTTGFKIAGRHWPVANPNLVVCLVHGFGEHIGRYEHVAAFFARHQIAVIGYDRSGHGASGGKRGHTQYYDLLLEEIGQLIEQAESRYPGVPLVLYGHSQGGNLVLNYLLKKPGKIKAVISTGPWIQLAFKPPGFKVFIGKLTRRLMPSFSQPNGLNPAHLSTDPEVGKAYIADPLVHDRVTTETGLSMLESGEFLNSYAGAFPAPLLLMHGEQDQITSPSATKAFASRVKGDVTLKIWSGLYHEIHNEFEKEAVLNTILEWLKARFPLS